MTAVLWGNLYNSFVSAKLLGSTAAQSNGKGIIIHCRNSVVLYLRHLVVQMTETDWVPIEFINWF